MKLSLNWLRDFAPFEASAEEISKAITFLGFEVEQVISTAAPKLSNVVVGEVLTRAKHPNADKLSVCTVDIGPAGGIKTIVCGAQNYSVGDRVPVALPGAVLPGDFLIKQSKIRGELSDGMMCSGRELGIGDNNEGLLLLDGNPALGTPINAVLPAGDTVFDVEITPNRPDCLSHLGIARELAAWFRLDLTYPKEIFRGDVGDQLRPDLLAQVRVDSPEDCPLYNAIIVTGVKVGPSPAWIQDRLKAVGLRAINNIVDVTNYVMLEYGQPLHAFDAKKIAGSRIIVRRAGDTERITTLDGKERVLSSRSLVIADTSRAIVVAGVMGGENSGVDPSTTDIVLEAAVFKPQSVRWTSRSLGLSSDSSYRYERGVDPHMAQEAAYRAIDLILASAGGRVTGPIFRIGGDVPWKREITVGAHFIRERLGFDVPDADMRSALESLEINVVRDENHFQGAEWTLSIPSWRDDLDRPIDLVEEILRVYGSDKIPPSTVRSPGLAADDDPVVLFNRKAGAYLVGHDFHECCNITLRPGPELTAWVSQAAAAELALANPFVEDQSHLRPTLIVGLLETLKLNQSRGVAASRLFETGRVFVEGNGQNFECVAVGFVIAQDERRLWRKREAEDFYTVKHHVASIAACAGIRVSGEPAEAGTGPGYGWQQGQFAVTGGLHEGWTARFGLVNPAMLRSLGVQGKVLAGIFVILPEKLQAAAARPRYEELSLFPAALRDIALVVDSATPAGSVRKALVEIGRGSTGSGFWLESADVFDVYEGEGLPVGKKSLALSLVFRSQSRTLTDDEVNKVFVRIQDEICRTTPYRLRA